MRRRSFAPCTAACVAATLVACGGGEPQPADFDVVIRGASVVDGTGRVPYEADVAVSDSQIVRVGVVQGVGAEEIDATGLYLAPGFIDVHSHAGSGLDTPDRSHARPLLAQGITTVLVNPDGGGPVNLAVQRSQLLADGLGVNVGQLVPHGSVRESVVGEDDRAPTPGEMARMKAVVRQGMEEGAFGLSSGPFYAPGSFATTAELIELARVAAQYGGVYTSHIRDESDYNIGLVAAVDEVIEVAREAGLPGIVTHIKALGPRVWGESETVVRHIEDARAGGVAVYADQYPYEASSTGLSSALLPRWAEAGGRDSLMARMDRPATLDSIKAEMVENLDRRGGADRIQFRRFEPDPSIEGSTLQDVADARGLTPVDAAVELFREGSPSIVSFNMDEADIRRFMTRPWTMTGSDGALPEWNVGVPHPRSYGAFPRKLRRYVVEEEVLDLQTAIRSMTGLPAEVFRMRNRGLIESGRVADLVVFDLAAVNDPATYTEPHQLAEGMVHVIVNGRSAIRAGDFTGGLHGKVLRHAPRGRTTVAGGG